MDPYRGLQLSGPMPPEVVVVYTIEAVDCSVSLVWVLCLN